MKLTLSKPCQEKWEQMEEVSKGKYCSVCCKNVTDFTNKTEREIEEAYSKNENICGRFLSSQLGSDMHISWLKSFTALLLTSGIVSFADAQKIDTLHVQNQPLHQEGVNVLNVTPTPKLSSSSKENPQTINIILGQPNVIRRYYAPPLYMIDNKVGNATDFRNLKPEMIKTLQFLEGDKAVMKYGEAAREGVVEIKTKDFCEKL